MGVRKLVCGVGVNDAPYNVVDKVANWVCPYYNVWRTMIKRAYSNYVSRDHPTYTDVTVCEEWHLFSNFKAWMETQYWEGRELDKDILSNGSKVYSPETCCFIPHSVNAFIIDCGAKRGEWPIGVYWSKPTGKFIARVSNPFGSRLYLGSFNCPKQAHTAWKKAKLELAERLAEKENLPEKVRIGLINRYL